MKKISCFPSHRASLFESASRKFLFFISLNLMYLALQLIVFRWKQIHFVLYFDRNTFLSNFTICFYDRNIFHMICGKCRINPVSKISIWPRRENKNHTRASLFQSLEDGKQDTFLCGLYKRWNLNHFLYLITIHKYEI